MTSRQIVLLVISLMALFAALIPFVNVVAIAVALIVGIIAICAKWSVGGRIKRATIITCIVAVASAVMIDVFAYNTIAPELEKDPGYIWEVFRWGSDDVETYPLEYQNIINDNNLEPGNMEQVSPQMEDNAEENINEEDEEPPSQYHATGDQILRGFNVQATEEKVVYRLEGTNIEFKVFEDDWYADAEGLKALDEGADPDGGKFTFACRGIKYEHDNIMCSESFYEESVSVEDLIEVIFPAMQDMYADDQLEVVKDYVSLGTVQYPVITIHSKGYESGVDSIYIVTQDGNSTRVAIVTLTYGTEEGRALLLSHISER